MKKFTVVWILFLCITALLSAKGQQGKEVSSESQKTEITYFTFSAAPDHLDHLQEMISAFTQMNKDTEINVETAGWDDYFNKLQVNIAGGIAPDVFELNYENFVTYASKGTLYDMSSLAASDSSFSEDVFYPRSYNAFQYKGVQYGLPETFSTVVLYYNKDLFDAAGLDYPEESWTWDDAIAAAKKIRDPENDVWGLYTGIQFWEFYKKIAQNGGSVYDQNGNVVIDSRENVEALQTMLDIQNKHGIMPTDAELAGVSDGDLFVSGKLGMLVSGIWMFSAFGEAEFDWDIEVEPGMSTKATHFFANALAMSSKTESPEASWEWVKFFTSSDESAQMRIRTGWELPTIQNQDAVAAYLTAGSPANRQAVFNSLKYSIVPPVIEKQNELQDGIGQYLSEAKYGSMTAEEALKMCRELLEDLK
ncbi:MAG: sugar ABC transporter substrate-binding protein [Spirochaetales bacterium]|nr:sugar ABC transporter substrate-binding protein [Spirochaetales bacterium]